jgi:hypothetical protein
MQVTLEDVTAIKRFSATARKPSEDFQRQVWTMTFRTIPGRFDTFSLRFRFSRH